MFNHVANIKAMVQVCDSIKETTINLSNVQQVGTTLMQATQSVDLQIADFDDAPEALSDGEFSDT